PLFVAYGTVESHNQVQFWNQESGVRGEFPLLAQGFPNAAACTSDAQCFAIGQDDGTAYVCEVAPRAQPHRFRAHEVSVHGMAFSPDGHMLATSAEDGLIKLWRVGRGSVPVNGPTPSTQARPTALVPATQPNDAEVREVRSFRTS